ncbi:MAG: phage holin family protein [Actinomycetaceae bacterium]|nr:phage holin family protein [Actinomycetaceae bacterium]
MADSQEKPQKGYQLGQPDSNGQNAPTAPIPQQAPQHEAIEAAKRRQVEEARKRAEAAKKKAEQMRLQAKKVEDLKRNRSVKPQLNVREETHTTPSKHLRASQPSPAKQETREPLQPPANKQHKTPITPPATTANIQALSYDDHPHSDHYATSFRQSQSSDSSTDDKTPSVATESPSPRPLSTLADMSSSAKTKASSIGVLVSKLSDQAHSLIQGEIDLAKAKGKAMATRMGKAIAMLLVAGVLGLYMLGILFHAAILAFSLIMPQWAAALVVAGALLLVIVVLLLIAKRQLQKGQQSKPEPQVGLKKNVEAVKKGLKNER